MSPRALLHRAGIDVTQLRLLTRTPNRVYRVRADSGRHLLLRLRPADALTPNAARVQQRWLAAIARDTDVTAPLVVPLGGQPAVDNVDNVDFDGRDHRDAALFTWVAGRRARGAKGFVAPAKLAAVGIAVGDLHRHAERFRVGNTTGLRRFDVDFFFPTDYASLRARDRELLKRLKRHARRAMNELGESPRRFGLIHGDLGPFNWVFHRGVARPVDFEEFGLGYFVFDLVQVLWTHSMWPRYDAYRAALFAAYARVRPLDEIERRHVPLFEALALLDWVNRRLRANDRASLKQWLGPTMKRVRVLVGDRP